MMRRKILFLIESLAGGGAEKVLYTLISNIDKKKFDITICTICEQGVYDDDIRKIVQYQTLIPSPEKNHGFLERLKHRIRYNIIYKLIPDKLLYSLFLPKGNDVEIAFVEGSSTKILSHSSNKNAKKIAWVHTDLINNHWIKTIYRNHKSEKKSYEKYDMIVGVSETVSDAIKRLYGLPNVTTVYNPVDSAQIKLMSRQVINIEKSSDKTLIVSTGRLVPQKGFDRLIRIMSRLKSEGINAELWILGEGIERPELNALIEQLGIQEYIKLLGFEKNPYAFMSKADLFICSSRSEGYSTAVTEAIILGLPVITTSCSGMEEILGKNGEYGIITKNNEKALGDAIIDTLTTPGRLQELKHKSENRRSYFDISARIHDIENILLQ